MRESILAGDSATVQRQVQAYGDIGVTHLSMALRGPGFYDREGLRLFATETIPLFRTKA